VGYFHSAVSTFGAESVEKIYTYKAQSVSPVVICRKNLHKYSAIVASGAKSVEKIYTSTVCADVIACKCLFLLGWMGLARLLLTFTKGIN